MARAGLGSAWACQFANDFDQMKVDTYRANWGIDDMRHGDVGHLGLKDLPPGTPDLAWASFPCQDLSLAGDYRGLGRERDGALTRSGTFWPFWHLMRELVTADRGPRTIVLENVYGALTSHAGQDFAAIGSALSRSGYRFGAVVINASEFVPQSRQRVFVIAIRTGEAIPPKLTRDLADAHWSPPALMKAYDCLPADVRKMWIWWNIPRPEQRNTAFIDIIEDEPTGVQWHTRDETKYLLSMMSDVNRDKVTAAKKSGRPIVGGVYRRTRPDAYGVKVQRTEVRFDDIAGCLRTPGGGSSRQSILIVDGNKVRSRLLSPREAARLMGLPDDYVLPTRYNDAYHVCGDGVVVPVVAHIAKHVIEPIIEVTQAKAMVAAE